MSSSFSRKPSLLLLRIAASSMLVYLLYMQLSDILPLIFTVIAPAASIAAGILLERFKFRFFAAAVVIAAAFIVVRALVFFTAGTVANSIDNALLSFTFFRFDSGFFPLFPAVIYLSLTYFSAGRNSGFVFVEIILNSAVFCLLLWNQARNNLTIFQHPGILTIFSILFFIIQLLILVLYSSDSRSTKKPLLFAAAVLPIFLLTVFLLYGFYSENASKDRGGLMQPTLFRFDFSDYVKLETEISMDNDLVMLFRNYGYLNSIYLRRFYLSGYKPERGFFLRQGPGEPEQLLNIPDSPTELDFEKFPQRVESEQEYFIVNFDPSSLIAMNYPVRISPLTNWQGSSFLKNYRVVSETVEQPSWELSESPILEMSPELEDFYTVYGEDEKIKALAEEITAGLETPYDKVIAVMFYLHDNYFYSLKPGVAEDGNQLHHFLFGVKKGYCSYFAFSMALMCRSIGIPARVAAGFFIDPQSGILNVYPVREDMAHAWVEVPFEGFGWVEFDPTTDRLAPGEDMEFSSLDSSEYSDLVEEIFTNEYSVEAGTVRDETTIEGSAFVSAVKSIVRFLRLNPGWIIILGYTVFITVFHLREAVPGRARRTERRLAACYKRARRLAAAFGCGRKPGESVLEHAARAELLVKGILPLAGSYIESVFSASMGAVSKRKALQACSDFSAGYRRLPRVKRLFVFLFPFIRFRLKNQALWVILLVPVLFLVPPAVHAQTQEGPESFLELAEREQDSENYEGALKLLNEGMAAYPDDWRLKKAAGDLYADRELYNLALEQYIRALEPDNDNPDVIYEKSVVEGLLNLDEESIRSLERLLEIIPDHYDALADLGWMYFKTFRLSKAEKLLLEAIKIYSDSPILYMTLGTVYSGMYDYENAEKYYMQSINMALDKGWDYFASVSYYNLSLLERGFYHYDKALEYTNKSIETGERAPGFISRAEIYLGKMDFETAFMNFQQAYTVDSTPLALMGQADLYLTFGLLDEALAHIQEVLKHDDESWMYYFGVDPDRHRMETDRLLMEIYYGLSKRARFSPSFGIGRLKDLFKSVRYRSLGWFHERRYREASFDVGQSNESHGNMLDAAWAYFKANEGYEPQAIRYLRRAEEIETSVAPESEASYLLEEGRLSEDPALLGRALEMLDPEWERLQISETLTELLSLEKGRSFDAGYKTAEELFQINPGVFTREGLSFPLGLDFNAGFFLRLSLKRSGFDISLNNDDYDYRYRLTTADKQDRGVLYSVVDGKTDQVILSMSVQGSLNTPEKVSAFVAELKKRLFRISDGKGDSLQNAGHPGRHIISVFEKSLRYKTGGIG